MRESTLNMIKSDKPTSERILDAAEELFAEMGYDATSLGDIADIVGIRCPGIYKHFKNKQSLYEAVLGRLFDPFCQNLLQNVTDVRELAGAPALVRTVVETFIRKPNIARLVQHATLAGGEQVELLVDRWYRPLFDAVRKELHLTNVDLNLLPVELPYILMAFNNMILGYVTLAPLHAKAFDIDTNNDAAIENQITMIGMFMKGLIMESVAKAKANKGAAAQG